MSNTKKVERKIRIILKEYQVSNLDLTTIKSWVYYDGGDWGLKSYHKFQARFLSRFKNKIKTVDEMNYIVDVLVEAWEEFPHQSLAGLSIRAVRQDTVEEKWCGLGIYARPISDLGFVIK